MEHDGGDTTALIDDFEVECRHRARHFFAIIRR
jgi:hypothetical protein